MHECYDRQEKPVDMQCSKVDSCFTNWLISCLCCRMGKIFFSFFHFIFYYLLREPTKRFFLSLYFYRFSIHCFTSLGCNFYSYSSLVAHLVRLMEENP